MKVYSREHIAFKHLITRFSSKQNRRRFENEKNNKDAMGINDVNVSE